MCFEYLPSTGNHKRPTCEVRFKPVEFHWCPVMAVYRKILLSPYLRKIIWWLTVLKVPGRSRTDDFEWKRMIWNQLLQSAELSYPAARQSWLSDHLDWFQNLTDNCPVGCFVKGKMMVKNSLFKCFHYEWEEKDRSTSKVFNIGILSSGVTQAYLNAVCGQKCGRNGL